MEPEPNPQIRRVLIASANPLFAKGLLKLFEERWGPRAQIVGLTANLNDTLKAMQDSKPDLVVVDYDDRLINRSYILGQFVEGDQPMQVILVSLKGNGSAVVYDRKSLTPSQAGNLLDLPALQPSMQEIRQAGKKGNAGRFAVVGLLVLISTTLLYLGLISVKLLPVEASQQGATIDKLFNFHFLAISFLFSLILVFMIYSVIVFKRRKGEKGDGVFRRGNNRLEILWTVIPLIAVLTISTVSASNLADTMVKDPQALVVNVTAGQWYWSFEYPDTGVTSQTLNLPVNRQVLLRMTSQDVIHSFWVPEFRVKQDVLPGEKFIKELRITPTLVGNYKVRCAEMCGVSHAYMESPVIVMEPSAYEGWIQEQVSMVDADPESRGASLAKAMGCVGCHSADGKEAAGPTWKGLFGSQVMLANGDKVTADEAYLHESIIHPNAQISQGFNPNLMPPNYGDKLTPEQINDLIAFIQSLK